MDTITIPTKEYRRLLEAKRTVDSKRRKGFSDPAFGVLKDTFRGKSSVDYISKLRKTWRS
jgi:hypothetical protein